MDIKAHKNMTEEQFLKNYNADNYARPSVSTDINIFTVQEDVTDNYRRLSEKYLCILLVKRGKHPFMGNWALPGGFVGPDETTEQAAMRELKEETGVDGVYLEQLYTFSDPVRDPRTRVICCSFMALADSGRMNLHAGDDADKAEWFRIQYRKIDKQKEIKSNGYVLKEQYELRMEGQNKKLSAVIENITTLSEMGKQNECSIVSNNGIAFDHAKIISYAVERLRGKLEYTDIALNLMPKEFTLTELQQVYEAILDKKLYKAAFRRKIDYLVEETDSYTENAGHRPSRMYKRKMVI